MRSSVIAQSVWRLHAVWTVRGSSPGGSEIFRTPLDRPWVLPSLLYKGYTRPFPGVERARHGVNHPPPSSAKLKERVELYLYCCSGTSWHVIGQGFRTHGTRQSLLSQFCLFLLPHQYLHIVKNKCLSTHI